MNLLRIGKTLTERLIVTKYIVHIKCAAYVNRDENLFFLHKAISHEGNPSVHGEVQKVCMFRVRQTKQLAVHPCEARLFARGGLAGRSSGCLRRSRRRLVVTH